MKLYYVEIAKQEYSVRSLRDGRRIVDREVITYMDDAGNEYRKSFEFKRGENPIIPPYGTHEEINALKYQW